MGVGPWVRLQCVESSRNNGRGRTRWAEVRQRSRSRVKGVKEDYGDGLGPRGLDGPEPVVRRDDEVEGSVVDQGRFPSDRSRERPWK